MRRKRNSIRLLIIATTLGLTILLICCGVIAKYSERVQLADNYGYLRTPDGVVVGYVIGNSRSDVLSRMKRGWQPPAVGPDVDGYRVYRNVIIGHVSQNWIGDKGPAYITSDSGYASGYFIIDLRHDIFHKGLGKKKWLEKLRGYGVKREPKLFKPAWYDEVLGRNRVCNDK